LFHDCHSGFGGLVVSMLASGTFGGLMVSMLASGTFGGLVVSMLASGKVRGSNPADDKIVTMCKLKVTNRRFKQKIMLFFQSLLISPVRGHTLLKFES
jgi:hypothetical protein